MNGLCEECGKTTWPICLAHELRNLRVELGEARNRAIKIERAARSLIDCPDFWKNAGTLPGEYDNLVDALKGEK